MTGETIHGLLSKVVQRAGVLAVCVALAACLSNEPAAATHIEFVTQPLPTVPVAEPLGNVEVALLTADGLIVSNTVLSVQVTLKGGDPTAVLGGTATTNSVVGVATFADLSVDRIGTGYKLIAKAAGFDSIVSTTFDVTVAPISLRRFEANLPIRKSGVK